MVVSGELLKTVKELFEEVKQQMDSMEETLDSIGNSPVFYDQLDELKGLVEQLQESSIKTKWDNSSCDSVAGNPAQGIVEV